jgi:hypothetical protein
MEEHKHRFACLVPLWLRWRFRPDVQSEAILVLLVPKVRRELVEDVETVPSKVRESRHRRYACWTVWVLISVSVHGLISTMSWNLPNLKPRRQCLQVRDSALARRISILLWVLAHT